MADAQPNTTKRTPNWAWIVAGTVIAGSTGLALWLLLRKPVESKPPKTKTKKIKQQNKTKTLQATKSPRYELVEQFAEAYGCTQYCSFSNLIHLLISHH
jgi:hypothetical protein